MGALPAFAGAAIGLYLLAALGLFTLLSWLARALGIRARVTASTGT